VSGGSSITPVSFDVTFTVEAAATYGISLSQTGTYTFTSLAENYVPVTPLTVTVTNTGTQPTGALTVALASGTNFTLGKNAISTIAVSGSDTFSVVPNTGLTAGIYTDTVTVSGGNGISATFDVSFTVAAAAYGITHDITSGAYTFPGLRSGYAASDTTPLTVTISNTGNQPTGLLTVTLNGTNSGSFTLGTLSISSLSLSGGDIITLSEAVTIGSIAVGGTASFTITPISGLAVGVYQATVTLSGGSDITPVSFDISLTVTAGTDPTPPPTSPTPTPTPTPTPVPELPFPDVGGHWAEADGSIAFVYERGLMRGTSATTFAPNATLTRAMFVTTLYRMEGEPPVEFSQVFTDVTGGKWYSDAVVWAIQNGIVQGVGKGHFAPEAAVSREQIAVLLYRYAAFKGYDDIASDTALESIFSDYHLVSSWAEEAMAWAVENKFIIGFDGKCMPLDPATRAECAALLSRFISHYAG